MSYEFKGTKGEWYLHEHAFACVTSKEGVIANCGTRTNNFNTEQLHKESIANAQLISKAPEMFEMLKEAQATIQRLKLSMLAHPDCTEGSEFDDYASTAQEVEDEIGKVLKEATEI